MSNVEISNPKGFWANWFTSKSSKRDLSIECASAGKAFSPSSTNEKIVGARTRMASFMKTNFNQKQIEIATSRDSPSPSKYEKFKSRNGKNLSITTRSSATSCPSERRSSACSIVSENAAYSEFDSKTSPVKRRTSVSSISSSPDGDQFSPNKNRGIMASVSINPHKMSNIESDYTISSSEAPAQVCKQALYTATRSNEYIRFGTGNLKSLERELALDEERTHVFEKYERFKIRKGLSSPTQRKRESGSLSPIKESDVSKVVAFSEDLVNFDTKNVNHKTTSKSFFSSMLMQIPHKLTNIESENKSIYCETVLQAQNVTRSEKMNSARNYSSYSIRAQSEKARKNFLSSVSAIRAQQVLTEQAKPTFEKYERFKATNKVSSHSDKNIDDIYMDYETFTTEIDKNEMASTQDLMIRFNSSSKSKTSSKSTKRITSVTSSSSTTLALTG